MPVDLTLYTVEALVWSGSAWVTYPGSGTAQGDFTIPNVPNGDFMVDVAGVYAYTAARTLDLGFELSGRNTAVTPTKTNSVAGNLTNLAAWNTSDQFNWYSAGTPAVAYGPPTPAPASNATTLTNSELFSWQGQLFDATKGDVLYASQLVAAAVGTSGMATQWSLTRWASFNSPALVQVDGTPLTVSGALTTEPAASTSMLDFRETQFVALGTDIGAGATADYGIVQILTAPGASAAGLFGQATTLYELYALADENVAASYANPFNQTWGQVTYGGTSAPVNYTASGATAANQLYGSIYVTFPTATAVAHGPIVPKISPVTTPTINGTSLVGTTTVTGVGLTPTLAWGAPTTGTPTEYLVTVYQLSAASGATDITVVNEIATTTTSITLPPSFLTAGNEYAIRVTAINSPINGSTSPFHWSPSVDVADFLSAPIAP